MAQANGMKFFETSARTGFGVAEAFESISRDIIKIKTETTTSKNEK